MKRLSVLLLFFITLVTVGAAQEGAPFEQYQRERLQEVEFGQAEWEKAKAGIDYSGEQRQREKTQETRLDEAPEGGGGGGRYEEYQRRQSGWNMDSKLAAGLLRFFAILILAIVLALILRGILGLEQNPKNKKLKKGASGGNIALEEIEENIHESDLDNYIRQALSQQQYALAIRLYYLAILKELSLQKSIRWKKDKTNRQYLMEMKPSPLYSSFAEATGFFEQVWYGGRHLDEEAFRQLEPAFRNLVEKAKG